MGRSKSKALLKTSKAVKLFAEGKNFDDIARHVGYANRGTAHRVVTKALEARVADDIDQLRMMEQDRLNDILSGLWGIIDDPATSPSDKIASLSAALKISERRCKLLGLYATPMTSTRMLVQGP